jgi:hypothetical protein
MTRPRGFIAALLAAMTIFTGGHLLPRSPASRPAISPSRVDAVAAVPSAAAPVRRPDVSETYGRLPLQFEANLGHDASIISGVI